MGYKQKCWAGYQMVGMKEKGGKQVPNCVAKGPNMVDKSKMSCNKPTKSSRPGKKKMVKACSGGKEKVIHFGASGYGHNYSAAARKSFKARHKCGSANDKLSARYWACKNLWAGKGGSTKSSPKSKRGKY